MKISLPTVGPIVGHTTDSLARIWMRGEFVSADNAYRRCFGVIRYRRHGTRRWSAPQFTKLMPYFDMTGVFVLSGLQPLCDYDYQTGWFLADSDLEKIQKMPPSACEWLPDLWSFRSGTADATVGRQYAIGSCRYLLRLFGGTIFDERGDKTFASIREQKEKLGLDALLMVGDQIYADDLNFVAPDVRIDEFFKRYRSVFSQPEIRRLMSSLPTYMILDDHEIEDNWPSKADKVDRITLYPHAIHAYQVYQCSHSPIFETTADGRIEGTLTHFWYRFDDGCASWFVMDARTERDTGQVPARMIKDAQMDALLVWLAEPGERVRFIVTSVPVFPDLNSDSDDKWGAFAGQREQILNFIKERNIRKVVFVSGDVHCSFTCELRSDEAPAFLVHQIVSSSFFWPYPHMQQNDFEFDQPLVTQDGQTYRVKLTSPVFSQDCFARVSATHTGLTVGFHGRKGSLLGQPVGLQFD